MKTTDRLARLLFLIGALCAATVCLASAQSTRWPTLHTHESYVEEVVRPTTLAVEDPMAVFAFVFGSLPDRVKVYPTENYYYFSFFHNGVKYDGNIRIEPADSGNQTVHFIYFDAETEWNENPDRKYIVLDSSRGVVVEKLERFLYRLSYGGKSVDFALNDLSDVKPPPTVILPEETFVGPIFDEAGIRFFLVYNSKLKDFLYILDETQGVADALVRLEQSDRILIGKRTGFAFYRDHRLDRKILIGVHFRDMRLNTYFDGPFDQLPDAFIIGDTLRDAILAIDPSLKGKIDRFGSDPSGDVRYEIDPYLSYRRVADLLSFHRCATRHADAPNYYNCFVREKLKRMIVEPSYRPTGSRVQR
jgi:hypothetical protein